MNIADILIILACLAGGYWIVSSVMSPGVDITRPGRPVESRPEKTLAVNPHQADWHLLLDVSRSASRSEIEQAFKHQMNKALAAGDARQQEQLRLARAAGLQATK